MSTSGRTRWVWPWVIAAVIAICAATLIFLRHRHPKLITTEDIAIAAASITLMTTVLAYWSAKASGDAARESRKALQLHYQPGKARVGFTTRDPHSQQGTPSPPGQLWMSIALWPSVQSAYELVWIDDHGQASAPVHVTPSLQGDINYDAGWFLLRGVSGDEVPNGGTTRVPNGLRFHIECRDDTTGSRWRASRSWPAGTELGSYALNFDPVDE